MSSEDEVFEGRLSVGTAAGPVLGPGQDLTIDDHDEERSLYRLLRPYLGAYVKITIERIEGPDADERRPQYQPHSKFSRDW